ncbi:MAG: hypothetical protein AAB553_03740 [Patescibacteria group bacterium]
MKNRQKDKSLRWFEKSIEEVKKHDLSEIERIALLAEAMVFHLEKKIQVTEFLVICNILIITASKHFSQETRRIVIQITELQLLKGKPLYDMSITYSMVTLLEELVCLFRKLIQKSQLSLKKM